MARGHSLYIKKITNREETLFSQLAKTGISESKFAKQYCNLSEVRLRKLERSKFIKLSKETLNGKPITVIQLASKGKEYIKDNFLHDGKLAVAQKNHLEHDLKLTKFYYELPDEIRRTWINERQLVREIYQNNKKLKQGELKTCLDAAVVRDGVRVGVEIVGKTYTEAQLIEKQEVAKNFLGIDKVNFYK